MNDMTEQAPQQESTPKRSNQAGLPLFSDLYIDFT
jgi:hypothetical protein